MTLETKLKVCAKTDLRGNVGLRLYVYIPLFHLSPLTVRYACFC